MTFEVWGVSDETVILYGYGFCTALHEEQTN
jgi:hypothetical protein